MILETRLILDCPTGSFCLLKYRDILQRNVARQLAENQTINHHGVTNGVHNRAPQAIEQPVNTNTKSLHQMVLETLKQPTNTGD